MLIEQVHRVMVCSSKMKLIAFLCAALFTKESSSALFIRQGRVVNTPQASVEVFLVVGIATVELEGDLQVVNYFDCITDLNNGSGLIWTRLTTHHRFAIGPIPDGSPGRRLRTEGISYSDLDVYTCSDRYSDDFSSINITNANPAIMAVQERLGIVQGSIAELEVYVSGYPLPTPSQIMWYRPGGFEITAADEGVEFQKQHRTLVLSNLQSHQAGLYSCTVVVSYSPYRGASIRIQLDIYVPPTFVTHPQETLDAVEWTEVTLNCSASGSPTPLITWQREGVTQLPVGTDISPSTATTSQLIFGMIRYDDGGRYRCLADNFETNVTLSKYADVRIAPALRLADDGGRPIITNLYFVEELSRIRLECFGTGNLHWTSSTGLDISPDQSGDIYQSYDHTRDALALTIKNFTAVDTAVYTCASDLTDVFDYNPISLSLLITYSNPAVFIQSRVQYVLAGNSTTLEATVYASPADSAVVQWYHKARFINTLNDTGYTASQDEDIHRLEIETVSEKELGEYTVLVTIEGGNATDEVVLEFLVAPLVNTTPSLISVTEGDEVIILCAAEGFGHQFTLDWSVANGSSLSSGVQQNGRELFISSATRSHAGVYVCLVSNAAGTTQANATLIVHYIPIAVISYNGLTSAPSQHLHLIFEDGAPGPTIVCSAEGHLPLTVEWIRENGRSLPRIIAQITGNGDVQLQWERPLKFTDSGSYICLASNNVGIGNATLEILVQIEPTINSSIPLPNTSTQSEDQSPSGVPRVGAIVSGLTGGIVLVILVEIVLGCVYKIYYNEHRVHKI